MNFLLFDYEEGIVNRQMRVFQPRQTFADLDDKFLISRYRFNRESITQLSERSEPYIGTMAKDLLMKMCLIKAQRKTSTLSLINISHQLTIHQRKAPKNDII